jgi:hypothetical protein
MQHENRGWKQHDPVADHHHRLPGNESGKAGCWSSTAGLGMRGFEHTCSFRTIGIYLHISLSRIESLITLSFQSCPPHRSSERKGANSLAVAGVGHRECKGNDHVS